MSAHERGVDVWDLSVAEKGEVLHPGFRGRMFVAIKGLVADDASDEAYEDHENVVSKVSWLLDMTPLLSCLFYSEGTLDLLGFGVRRRILHCNGVGR